MEKWHDAYKEFWIPLNWHGPDDDVGGDDTGGNDAGGEAGEDVDEIVNAAEGSAGKVEKQSSRKNKKKGDELADDTDITDDVPEDVDSLSAQELRDLIRTQGAELKKTRVTARKRLHEIMEKKEKHRELEERQEALRLKELADKQKYKELYEEIAPKYDILKKDVSKTHLHLESRFEEVKEDLPEEYHALIPNVDVRDKIAWVENFKKTVVAKLKPSVNDNLPDSAPDADSTANKNKVGAGVGAGGTPPEGNANKKTARETIEVAIDNCKSPEELDRLIKGLATKGIKNM